MAHISAKEIFHRSAKSSAGRASVALVFSLGLAAACLAAPIVYIDKVDFYQSAAGAGPVAAPTGDAAGDIFGVTTVGGSYNEENYNKGTVWEFTASGTLKTLHAFGGKLTNGSGQQYPDGINPASPILIDSAGNLYGACENGGPAGGMLWEITASGVYKDLHDFGGTVTNADGSSGPDGFEPIGSLYRDSSGDIFGVTEGGGPNADSDHFGGNVWELTAGGVYRDLHDFGGTVTNANGVAGPDGLYPLGGVTVDSVGNLYGTAYYGGPNGYSSGGFGSGMVWMLTPSGTYTDLHDFGGTTVYTNGKSGPDGYEPDSNVVLDSSGDMYGTVSRGGEMAGLLWKISSVGVYSDIHDFIGTVLNANGDTVSDGLLPEGQISIDASGNLYGTTWDTVTGNDDGMVWELSAAGKYTDLHDFGDTVTLSNGQLGTDGSKPVGLTLDSSGFIYGACNSSIGTDGGMVWEIRPQKIVSLALSPSTIGGLGTSTATVAIAGPASAGGYKVNLNAGASGYLSLPASITIPESATSATFTITGLAQRSATINMGIIATGPYSYLESILVIQGDEVEGLSFNPTAIGGDGSTVATVSILSAAPPGGWIIHPKEAAAGYLTMPATVTVPAGATSTTFTITGANQRTGTAGIGVIASDGNASVESILTVQGDSLKSIVLNPTTMGWSANSTGTVTLNAPAPQGGWVVKLKAGATGYLSMPASVSIPAGATTATFSVTGATQKAGSVTIGVIANDTGTQVETDLTLTGDSLISLSVSPANVLPGGQSTGTVTLSGPAPAGGWVVKLWTGAPTDVMVPATVKVPAGQTSTTFSITTYSGAIPSNYGVFANDDTAQYEVLLTIT